MLVDFPRNRNALYAWAASLALMTIVYNIVEGLVSVYFGLEDESLSLFGFGVDSFVEVISGIGIWHMVRRIQLNNGENLDRFEQRALRTTGASFYVLAVGLAVTSLIQLYQGHKPESAFWGIVVSSLSILSMWALIRAKVTVGKRLGSAAILADAACTRVCLQLSAVLLAASVGYRLTGIGELESFGALLIGGLCLREGREALVKARTGRIACSCGGSCQKEEKTTLTSLKGRQA